MIQEFLCFFLCVFSEISNGKSAERNSRAFVMRVSEDEVENGVESKGEEVHTRSLVAVKRFTCDELYLRYNSHFGPLNLCALFDNKVLHPMSYIMWQFNAHFSK